MRYIRDMKENNLKHFLLYKSPGYGYRRSTDGKTVPMEMMYMTMPGQIVVKQDMTADEALEYLKHDSKATQELKKLLSIERGQKRDDGRDWGDYGGEIEFKV